MDHAKTYSRQVLEETPLRVIAFLRGVGTSSVIRTSLATRGYTAKDHAEGWALLHQATGYAEPITAPTAADSVQQAITTLDGWDEPTFRIAKAALERLHPDQAAYVFDNLAPATGPAAILTVRTFLQRLDDLEKSPDRLATRIQDKAAINTLSKRGITKTERDRMKKLVAEAQTFDKPEPVEEPQSEQRLADLAALRAWYDDWSEMARTLISRRDHLIRLGLAKRKKKAKVEQKVA